MYVHPFILGVLCTLAVEAVILVVAAYISNARSKRRGMK